MGINWVDALVGLLIGVGVCVTIYVSVLVAVDAWERIAIRKLNERDRKYFELLKHEENERNEVPKHKEP